MNFYPSVAMQLEPKSGRGEKGQLVYRDWRARSNFGPLDLIRESRFFFSFHASWFSHFFSCWMQSEARS